MLTQLAQAEEDVTDLVIRQASALPRASKELSKHEQQLAVVDKWLGEYEKTMSKEEQQVKGVLGFR